MKIDLNRKTALITGSSRGIGRAIAAAFAAAGARVIVHFNQDAEAAQETLDQLPAVAGGEHFAIRTQLDEAARVKQMMDKVLEEVGRLDILVNNAGVFEAHDLFEVDYKGWQQAWQRTLEVNLLSVANLTYLAARHMKEAGGGAMVNVSSRGAFRGEPNHPAYGASKAGLNSFSQSMAWRLAKDNIFVGVVAPGFVLTDMTEDILTGPDRDRFIDQSPMGRVARPEEIANAVLFLASGKSPYATGSILDVNGASYLRS